MTTSLITGGSGFLGSNLCARLLRAGRRVICLDNNYTGRMENIAELQGNANFCFVEHDVCSTFDPGEHVDEIYNLACPASPPVYQRAAFYRYHPHLRTASSQHAKKVILRRRGDARQILLHGIGRTASQRPAWFFTSNAAAHFIRGWQPHHTISVSFFPPLGRESNTTDFESQL